MCKIHWPAKPPTKPSFDVYNKYSRMSSLLARPTFKAPVISVHSRDSTRGKNAVHPPADLLRSRGRMIQKEKPEKASFLGLPLEMREMIYHCVNAGTPAIKPIANPGPSGPRHGFAGNGLLQVSKQIHQEYKHLILRTMHIRLDILGSGPHTKQEKKILRKASHLTIWATLSVGDDYRSRELSKRYEEQVDTWANRIAHNTKLKSMRILITQACFTKCDSQYYPYDSDHECAHLDAFKAAAEQLGNVKISGHISLKWDPTFQASPACVWQSRAFLDGIKKEMMNTLKVGSLSKGKGKGSAGRD